MTPDIKQMLAFYNSPLGVKTRTLLQKQINMLSPDVRGQNILGLGFTSPYLRPLYKKAQRTILAMSARMGPKAWPNNAPNCTILCDPQELPISDASIDLIIAVHSFEYVNDSEDLMRELWRIAAPNAQIIVIVPRRHGIWAQRDNTPLGFGHPYSRSQLDKLLNEHNFIPQVWSEALYLPPSNLPLLLKSSNLFEKGGRVFGATFASIMCVRAKKQLFPAVPRRKRKQRLVRIPILAPQAAMKLPKTINPKNFCE